MLLDEYVQLSPIGEVCKEMVVAFHESVVKKYSRNGELDRDLYNTLPVFQQFLCNQTWLIWLREEVDWIEIKEEGEVLWRIAIPKNETLGAGWEIPIPNASQFNDAVLAVVSLGHYLVLDFVNYQDYQNEIDTRCKDKPSEEKSRIIDLLITQWYHLLLMESFYGELVRRVRNNDLKKHTWGGLIIKPEDEDLRRQQLESYQWLQLFSHRIAHGNIEDGEDALHDWAKKLNSMPFHIQIQKLGATRKAISAKITDFRRKGGKYGHVSLDDTLADVITDESQETPDELRELLSTEMGQQIMKKRPQIEAVLSADVKREKKQVGTRRFIVLLESDKTSEQLAAGLGVNEKTVDRDRAVIQEKRRLIQEIVWD